MSLDSERGAASRRSVRTWLFNPFHYVAGGRALGIGVVLILAAGFAGSLSNSHFDGVLDFHTGRPAPLWAFLCEGPIDWLVLASLLFFGGKLISRSRVRMLDVFGTQALARFPTAITATLALLPRYRRFAADLAERYRQGLSDVEINAVDAAVFVLVALVSILMIAWMVALMYRAYSVSCNVTGGRAIGVFVAALILGEAISKVAIYLVLVSFS